MASDVMTVRQRPTVLVIDDNADTNRVVCDRLADTYRVITAHGTGEGVGMAAGSAPDLIIVATAAMPDATTTATGGGELLAALRRRPELAAVPIVVLTASADAETRAGLLRAGAQDYITTPIVVEELRARVAKLVAIKRAGDVLKEGLAAPGGDLEALARAQMARQRDSDLALEEAERANRSKDEFLSVVSHELRTPLNVIQGWMWQLKRPGTSEQMKQRALTIIERNIAMQARLVDDLLDTSRAGIGKLHLRKRVIDLGQACRAAADGIERLAEAKGLTVSLDVPEAPLFIRGDMDRIQQAIANVLSNAIKFTPSGGTIAVSAQRQDTRARIVIRDTGEGIPREFLASMFEPFAQADRSSTKEHGGLGLGLAIVKHIATLHGGTVTATSDGEHGTAIVFEFGIPAVLDEPEPQPSHDQPEQPAPQRLNGLKVLVVDDEAEACEAVRMVLEHHGASVQTTTSGAEALTLLPKMQPDVLLADLSMPGLDGYELIREVRRRTAPMHLPAVALTAHTEDAKCAALVAGFQQFTCKPIPPADLVTLVGQLCERAVH
jgi:signal transduction histidine kinase